MRCWYIDRQNWEKSLTLILQCFSCLLDEWIANRDAGGFGISVNPIRTKGGRLCPPYYYVPPPPHLFGRCGVSGYKMDIKSEKNPSKYKSEINPSKSRKKKWSIDCQKIVGNRSCRGSFFKVGKVIEVLKPYRVIWVEPTRWHSLTYCTMTEKL